MSGFVVLLFVFDCCILLLGVAFLIVLVLIVIADVVGAAVWLVLGCLCVWILVCCDLLSIDCWLVDLCLLCYGLCLFECCLNVYRYLLANSVVIMLILPLEWHLLGCFVYFIVFYLRCDWCWVRRLAWLFVFIYCCLLSLRVFICFYFVVNWLFRG